MKYEIELEEMILKASSKTNKQFQTLMHVSLFIYEFLLSNQ